MERFVENGNLTFSLDEDTFERNGNKYKVIKVNLGLDYILNLLSKVSSRDELLPHEVLIAYSLYKFIDSNEEIREAMKRIKKELDLDKAKKELESLRSSGSNLESMLRSNSLDDIAGVIMKREGAYVEIAPREFLEKMSKAYKDLLHNPTSNASKEMYFIYKVNGENVDRRRYRISPSGSSGNNESGNLDRREERSKYSFKIALSYAIGCSILSYILFPFTGIYSLFSFVGIFYDGVRKLFKGVKGTLKNIYNFFRG